MDIIASILALIQPVILALAGWGLKALVTWLNTKTRSEELRLAMQQMSDAALVAVRVVYQLLVDELKGTQRWDATQMANAKEKAMVIMRNNLGPTQIARITKLYGYSDLQLNSVMSDLIEKSVYLSKIAYAGSINLEPIKAAIPEEIPGTASSPLQ